MALTGTFDDIGFAELLQMLHVGHKSGRLRVWREGEQADLYLVDGEVARAVSSRERGADVVYRILGWKAGEFSFEPGNERVPREITESTDALILEGMKRFDEWQRVEAEMPDMHVVLRQRAFAVNEHFESLSPEAQIVLRLVDAQRDVATIVRESGLEPMRALVGVTELLSEHIVEEWKPASPVGQVAATGGGLPEARGEIDFRSSSYFSSKTQLLQHREKPSKLSSGENDSD
jgi:hypothetical protein